jgi:hypothetical protein
MLRRPLAAVVLALLCAGAAAQAVTRPIPADARRGTIRHLQEMIVEIDGKSARLAPGAQIRDAANRVVVPAAVPAGALVRYTVNPQGHVQRVWILTPYEAALPEPRK